MVPRITKAACPPHPFHEEIHQRNYSFGKQCMITIWRWNKYMVPYVKILYLSKKIEILIWKLHFYIPLHFCFISQKQFFLALFVSFFCSYLCKSIFISQSAKDKHDKEQHKWNRRKRITVRRKERGPTHFSSTPSKKWSQNQLRPCCPYTITSFYYLTFKKYVYIPTNSHRMPIEQNTE